MNSISTIIDHVQNLGITSSVNIDWPPEIEKLQAIKLDFQQFNYSFRSQVMVLVNLLPFVLSIILLALFKPIHIVVIYIIGLAAIGSFLMGVVIYFVPSTAFALIKQYANILIGAGAGLMVILAGIYAYSLYKKRKKKREIRRRINPDKESLLPAAMPKPLKTVEIQDHDFEEDEVYDSQAALNIASIKKGRLYKRKPWYILLKNGLISASLLYFGVLLADLDTPGTPNWLVDDDTYAAVGYFLIAFGSAIGIHFLLSLFYGGRKFLFKSGRWFSANIGSTILFLMTILYIPLTNSIFKIFACAEQTCSSGYELVRNFDVPTDLNLVDILKSFASVVNTTETCTACNFTNTCLISSQLCAGEQDFRLLSDTSLSCMNDVYPYYLPGAIPVLFLIIFGIPVLFYRLVTTSTKLVGQAPEPDFDSKDQNEIWEFKMDKSQNICRNLYLGFKYKYRHYQIILFIQKMLIVAIAVFGFYLPDIVLIVLCAFHFTFFLVSIIQRPYTSPLVNALGSTCFFLNSATAGVGISVSYGVSIPSYVFVILGVVNIAFPIGFFIFQIWIEMKKSKEQKKALKAGKKVKDFATDEDKLILKEIDSELDSYSVHRIVEYFLMLGLACFLSICITTIGVIRSTTNSNVLSSSVPTLVMSQGASEVSDYEFAGYSDWTEFTANCCCEQKDIYTDGTLNSEVVEIWKCLSNSFSDEYGGHGSLIYKRKLRVSKDLGNGFPLRDYCSTSFKTVPGQTCGIPYYNSTFGRFTVNDCSTTQNMTSDILQYLW